MSRNIVLAAALAALMGCTAAARASASASETEEYAAMVETPASCDIRVVPTARGARFQALAYAEREMFVDYDLIIAKSDADGSSEIVQGGSADIGVEPQALGEAEISLGERARYSARLVLKQEGAVLCRAEQTS